MKRKELKELAKKIAKQEKIIQESDDPKIQQAAQEEIMRLSGHIKSLEDMTILDEMIQEILA